jgi:ABC-type Mn2+/Zn2+ transport system ATPase subunit
VRLTRFAADNLLSFRHVDLELDTGLTVIVGPNGSGKTNLVRVLMLAGLVLEWLEERDSHLSGPQGRSTAQNALASYAASRCRNAQPAVPIRVEVGLELGTEDLDDLACFVRAAIVSTLLAQRSSDEGGQVLAAWAGEQITADAVIDLGRGVLVLQYNGSPDAPWQVSWEFRHGDVSCRWALSDYGGRMAVVGEQSQAAPSGRVGGYTQLAQTVFDSPSDGASSTGLPPLRPFSLEMLYRQDGPPVEALLLQASSGHLDPELAPHRSFADLVEIPLWTQQPNRVYSLAWVLRRVFQRGLVIIGEQFRGVGTMAAPLRPAGLYSIRELAAQAPNFDPYALPLRLLRLKNGDQAGRHRFREVQRLFGELASGRGLDLSMQVVAPAQATGQRDTGGDDGEAVVTILVTSEDSPAGSSWELPVQLCGAGTWEAVVLAEVLASAPSRVIVLDEPALNLHPGWQQLLLAQLRRYAGSRQSVLITHSPYLVPVDDEADIYRLVRADRSDGVTRLSRARYPLTDARAVVRDYSMSADARSLLFASGAVLLEGETELGALPLWFAKSPAASTLGDPRSLHLAFYSVGGEDHFKAPLTLLAALNIPWVIVCDGGPLRTDKGRKHLFCQVAAAGAATPDLKAFIMSALDDPAAAHQLTFAQAVAEAHRHGIFTLAPSWDRTKTDGISAESFEAFVQAAPGLAGQLAVAKQEVGNSKTRQGRWLAENHPSPQAVSQLYHAIVATLKLRAATSAKAP